MRGIVASLGLCHGSYSEPAAPFAASSKLILTVDATDDNYMPKRVTVYGGEGDNLKKLSDVTIDE